jgi:hypothetical protein
MTQKEYIDDWEKMADIEEKYNAVCKKKKPLFTLKEVAEMVREYESGLSYRQIGERHICCRTTVMRYIKHMVEKRKRTNKVNTAMFINDWNANVLAEKIAYKYGITNRNAVYQEVFRLRKAGHKLRRRKVVDWG